MSLPYIDEATRRNIKLNETDYDDSTDFRTIAVELDAIISEYIKILGRLSSASSGALATNLSEFKTAVQGAVGGSYTYYFGKLSSDMSAYETEIDTADSALY